MKTLKTKTLLLTALVVSSSPVVAMDYLKSAKDAVVNAAVSSKNFAVKHGYEEPVAAKGLKKAISFTGLTSPAVLDGQKVGIALNVATAAATAYGLKKAYDYVTSEEETAARGENSVVAELNAAKIGSFTGVAGLTAEQNKTLTQSSNRFASLNKLGI